MYLTFLTLVFLPFSATSMDGFFQMVRVCAWLSVFISSLQGELVIGVVCLYVCVCVCVSVAFSVTAIVPIAITR